MTDKNKPETDLEIIATLVRFIAFDGKGDQLCSDGWPKGVTEDCWNPLENWADCMMVEDKIAEAPIHVRQLYINSIYNAIVGVQEIVGVTRVQWGLLHATKRQRCMAALAILEILK